MLWAVAIALFYNQWGKINGQGLHQLDYVHANLDASPEKGSHKNSIVSPGATCVGSSSESGDHNVLVSMSSHVDTVRVHIYVYNKLPHKIYLSFIKFW